MIGALVAKRNVLAGFDAFSRHDLEALLRNFSANAVFVYPGDISPSGTYTGKETIRAWFQRHFEQFPTIRFTVKHVAVTNLFDMIGSNVTAAHWEVDVINRDGLAGHNSGVTLFTIKQGKIVHLQDFIFNTGEKFRAAWGEGGPKE